jgi:hypothetical protein
MRIAAGYCVLIIDGKRLDKFSFAIEVMDGSNPPSYGLLSGPVETLKRAATAGQVLIELGDGLILDARVLQVNQTGIALVSIKLGGVWPPANPRECERHLIQVKGSTLSP